MKLPSVLELLLTPREELAWLAGLLEGEGCFLVRGKTVNIVLNMTDRDVVERAAGVAGVGNVVQINRQAFADRESAQAVWQWKLSKRHEVLALCRVLLPFMGERRAAKIQEVLATEIEDIPQPIWERVARI